MVREENVTTEAESVACYIAGFEEERGPGTKECKQPLGARKGKETASPLETLGESHNTLRQSNDTHVKLLTYRTVRK